MHLFFPSALASLVAIATILAALSSAANATESDSITQLREEIKAIQTEYDARMRRLEQRLHQAETAAKSVEITKQTSTPQTQPTPFSLPLSLILSGSYSNLSQDPAGYEITGYGRHNQPSPYGRGFSLAESELNLSGNVDAYFRAAATLALLPDNSFAVENAYVQTSGLGDGWGITAGRFFSGIGYLNAQHKHAWDFVDEPLAYRALLGGQFALDAVQATWLAPADSFLQLGAEAGRGLNFFAPAADKNGADLATLFVKTGGDMGDSVSWLGGLSLLRTAPKNLQWDEVSLAGIPTTNAYTGSSRLVLANFVLKWSPDGNPAERNFKLQGEYLRLSESGTVVHDLAAANTIGNYAARREGGYVQGIYQFTRGWRAGLRYDRLSGGGVDYGANNINLPRSDYHPSRASTMLDYSPSEFSRIRLQLGRDRSRQGATDNQLFVQYQMSLGAHGGHKY